MNFVFDDLLDINIESASKKSESLFDAPLSVSVITKEEIKRAAKETGIKEITIAGGVSANSGLRKIHCARPCSLALSAQISESASGSSCAPGLSGRA